MNIREKICQMPAWKAAILALLSIGLIVISIEEYCINKLFSVMDKIVANFEVQFSDDAKDMENDYKEFNATQEYDKAKSDFLRFKLNQNMDDPDHTQKLYCAYLTMNKRLQTLYNILSYVKHHDETRKSIALEIEKNKKFITAASDKKIFDISQCKDIAK